MMIFHYLLHPTLNFIVFHHLYLNYLSFSHLIKRTLELLTNHSFLFNLKFGFVKQLSFSSLYGNLLSFHLILHFEIIHYLKFWGYLTLIILLAILMIFFVFFGWKSIQFLSKNFILIFLLHLLHHFLRNMRKFSSECFWNLNSLISSRSGFSFRSNMNFNFSLCWKLYLCF